MLPPSCGAYRFRLEIDRSYLKSMPAAVGDTRHRRTLVQC